MDNCLVQLSLDFPVVFTLQSSNKSRDKSRRFLQSGKEHVLKSGVYKITNMQIVEMVWAIQFLASAHWRKQNVHQHTSVQKKPASYLSRHKKILSDFGGQKREWLKQIDGWQIQSFEFFIIGSSGASYQHEQNIMVIALIYCFSWEVNISKSFFLQIHLFVFWKQIELCSGACNYIQLVHRTADYHLRWPYHHLQSLPASSCPITIPNSDGTGALSPSCSTCGPSGRWGFLELQILCLLTTRDPKSCKFPWVLSCRSSPSYH